MKGKKKVSSKKSVKQEKIRTWLGMELPVIHPSRRNLLLATPVLTKIFVAILTVVIFRSFIDMFDYGNYYLAVQNILAGLWPWAKGSTYYYPPLSLLPMSIAFLGSVLGGSMGFVVTMWILMTVCDIVTVFCVYYVGLRIYQEQTAFIAAMLCATAISAAYYSLTKFDSFPVTIAAMAMLFTVYGEKTKGYLASIIGLFVKLWPIVLYPFLWIYNARESSVVAEGKARALPYLAGGGAVFGVMILLGYNKFLDYTNLVYSNTLLYLASRGLQVTGAAIPLDALITVFRVLMVLVFLGAVYWMSRNPGSETRMMKMVLLSLVVLIFFIQYRSPQYTAWLVPFAALLVAGDVPGILSFYLVQVLGYIEFPLSFRAVWVNQEWKSGWAPVLFVALFAAYGLLLWRAMKAPEAPAVPPGNKGAE